MIIILKKSIILGALGLSIFASEFILACSTTNNKVKQWAANHRAIRPSRPNKRENLEQKIKRLGGAIKGASNVDSKVHIPVIHVDENNVNEIEKLKKEGKIPFLNRENYSIAAINGEECYTIRKYFSDAESEDPGFYTYLIDGGYDLDAPIYFRTFLIRTNDDVCIPSENEYVIKKEKKYILSLGNWAIIDDKDTSCKNPLGQRRNMHCATFFGAEPDDRKFLSKLEKLMKYRSDHGYNDYGPWETEEIGLCPDN